MSASRGALVFAFVSLVAACGPTTFVCEERTECVREQKQGRCEPNSRCSYRDETCASGWRYGANAGSALADQCVEPEPSTSSSGDAGSSSSGTSTSTTGASTSTGATSSEGR